MADWDVTAQDYLTGLARQPAARQPATFGEIWDSNWKAGGLDTFVGVGQPYREAVDELRAGIESAAGKTAGEYARARGVNLGVTPEQQAQGLAALIDTFDDDTRKKLDPLKDPRKRAADKAQAIEREAADVAAATYGLSGNATAFLSGVARQTVDPVNIAAMVATAPLGGPFEGPILKVIARQAFAGAVGQAVVEPAIEGERKDLGLDYGFGRAARNVAEAGIGGGVLAGLFRGGAAAVRLARGRSASAGVVDSISAPEAGHFVAAPETRASESGNPVYEAAGPLDLEAAARLAERDHAISASAGDLLDHAAGVDAANRAIETGRPIGEVLAQEGVRLPPQMERLSELQLGDIAENARRLETAAQDARAGIETRLSDMDLPRSSRLEAVDRLRGEVGDVQADIERIGARLTDIADPSTAERLAAIEAELAQAVPAARRQDLLRERDLLQETIAATQAQNDKLAASLRQEQTGLKRLLARKRKAFDAASAAHQKIEAQATSLVSDAETAAVVSASQRELIGNELRRAISSLAEEGYGVRLPREAAQELADLVLLAKPDELPATLRSVTDHLVDRALAARQSATEQLAARLQGVARFNGRNLDGQVAFDLAAQLERADRVEILSIIDSVVGEPRWREALRVAEQRAARAPVEPPAAKPASAEVAAKTGDDAIARDAERALADAGEDLEIVMPNGDGTFRKISARQALAEAEDDARAVKEFNDCLGVMAEAAE